MCHRLPKRETLLWTVSPWEREAAPLTMGWNGLSMTEWVMIKTPDLMTVVDSTGAVTRRSGGVPVVRADPEADRTSTDPVMVPESTVVNGILAIPEDPVVNRVSTAPEGPIFKEVSTVRGAPTTGREEPKGHHPPKQR